MTAILYPAFSSLVSFRTVSLLGKFSAAAHDVSWAIEVGFSTWMNALMFLLIDTLVMAV
jgi:hypothetical protein